MDSIYVKYGKTTLFLLIIIAYLFILPSLFLPEYDPNGANCGMPALGITLAFGVIGGGATILIHIIYHLIRKWMNGKLNDLNLF
jgi:hypothetical protein